MWYCVHFMLLVYKMNSSGTQNLITVRVSESILLRLRSKCAYFSLVAQMCQNKENIPFGLHQKCSASFLHFRALMSDFAFIKSFFNDKKYSLWLGCEYWSITESNPEKVFFLPCDISLYWRNFSAKIYWCGGILQIEN